MNTKKTNTLVYIFLAFVNISLLTQAQEQKTTLVFAPIEVKGFGNGEFSTRLSEKIIENTLYSYPQYRILERDALDRVFRELKFTLTYDNTSRASEVGNFLGADFVILIKVENKYQKSDAGWNDVTTGQRMYNFNLSCRATIKVLSLRDGSIRDLYNSPGRSDNMEQGISEESIGWVNSRPLLDCFIDLFFRETQNFWANNFPYLQR